MRSRNFAKNFAAVANCGAAFAGLQMSLAIASFCAWSSAANALPKRALRLRFDPREAGQDELAIGALLRIRRADPLVDEVHDADRGRRGRDVVGRDDEIAQRRGS